MQLHNPLLYVVALWFLAQACYSLECHGDGWGPTEDKCIKLFAEQMSMEEGQELCAQEYMPGVDIMTPRLLEVSSAKDQALIEGYLRKNPYAPGFWLGAVRVADSADFRWSMNYELEFSNWAPGHPSNVSDRQCVELQSEASKVHNSSSSLGLWKDVLCTKGNWVICERIPALSMLEIVLAIRALNKKVTILNGTTLQQIENVVVHLNSSIDSLAATHEADVTSMNDSINQLGTSLTTTIDQLEALHVTDVTSLTEGLTTLETEVSTVKNTHNSDVSSIDSRISGLQSSHNTLSNNVSVLNTELSGLSASHNQLSSTVSQLNTKVNTIDGTVGNISAMLTTARTDIVALRSDIRSTVPVGFVFFQLPSQPEPRTIWPQYTWTEISSTYAGHFFRVIGGNSAGFGTAQGDAFQGHFHSGVVTGGPRSGTDNTNDKSQVDFLYTGNTGNAVAGYDGTPRTASETRPMNYAIKVWKRTA